MTIVSTREFRANQTKFLGMASRGEHVVLKSRLGSYRLIPIEEDYRRRGGKARRYSRDLPRHERLERVFRNRGIRQVRILGGNDG